MKLWRRLFRGVVSELMEEYCGRRIQQLELELELAKAEIETLKQTIRGL